MKPRDEALAARAAAGDDIAFGILVDRHRTALLRTAASRLGPLHSDAEDVVQDALGRAHRNLRRRGTAPSNTAAWLHAIVRNRAVDIVRLARHGDVPLDEHDGASEALDDGLVRREQVDAVMSAIDDLPARQRDALVDVVFAGASYRQVAATQQTSVSAVKALVNRARRSVREAAAALLPFPALLRDRILALAAHGDPGIAAGLVKGCAVAGTVATLSLTVGPVLSVPLHPAVADVNHQAAHFDDQQLASIAAHGAARERSDRREHRVLHSATASGAIAACVGGQPLPSVTAQVLREALQDLPSEVAEYTSCGAQLHAALAP